MSLIIKDVRMPDDCYDCVCCSDCYFCNLLGRSIPFLLRSNGRLENCPLVELPEHHGRLIDENEVRTVINWLLTQPQRPTWNDTYNTIKEMNAVIEAE